jgi:hypothetical protein
MNTMQTDEGDLSVATLDHIDRLDPPRRSNPPPILPPPRYSAPGQVEADAYSAQIVPPHVETIIVPAHLEAEPPTHPDNEARILRRLLSMADVYRASGSLRQAIEMYFSLIRDYGDSPQAIISEERLLEIANSYVRTGEMKQARGIYEQLL